MPGQAAGQPPESSQSICIDGIAAGLLHDNGMYLQGNDHKQVPRLPIIKAVGYFDLGMSLCNIQQLYFFMDMRFRRHKTNGFGYGDEGCAIAFSERIIIH